MHLKKFGVLTCSDFQRFGCNAVENKTVEVRLIIFAVRTERFASAARRKWTCSRLLPLSWPGEASRHNALSWPDAVTRLLLCLGRAKPRAHFLSGRVALLWSYGARVEPAQRCENNFTSERRWASRIFTVSRRSPARGN